MCPLTGEADAKSGPSLFQRTPESGCSECAREGWRGPKSTNSKCGKVKFSTRSAVKDISEMGAWKSSLAGLVSGPCVWSNRTLGTIASRMSAPHSPPPRKTQTV